MAKELPEDLVTQILLWLPVVSLLRFKCVSKSWYALIIHQNFVTKHMLNNNNNSNALFLLKTFKDCFVSTFSYEALQLYDIQPLPPPYFGMGNKVQIYIVGSCNGLVCLHANYNNGLNVVIWNPATKETKIVPKSNLPYPARNGTKFDRLGFGFDAKTNDYKIINLLTICDSDIFGGEIVQQKEVYSLCADSWRKVDGPLCYLLGSQGPKAYINGMTFWEAKECINGMTFWEANHGDDLFVLSFEMSDEVFVKTPLPDDIRLEFSAFWGIFVLNESIAMVGIAGLSFDIWLLPEVGVKNSWSKLFTIGPLTEIGRPLGFWKNEIIFLKKFDGQTILYDLSTKQKINLQIRHGAIFSWHMVRNMVNYMETLVSVKGGRMNLKSRIVVDNAGGSGRLSMCSNW
jgi:F-box interacting protein